MRIKALNLATSLLSVSLSFGQSPPELPAVRSFQLSNPPSARGYQELATVLRTVGSIKQLSLQATSSSLAVSGSTNEVAMAEWIVHELDQPAQQTRDTAIHEYSAPGQADDVVRMFYLSHIIPPQGVQELLTVLRTVENVQKTFTYSPLNAIAVRDTRDRMAMAAWAIQELDQAPGAQTAGTHEFRSSDRWTPVVRVFYLKNHATKDLQEIVKDLRSKSFIRYVFTLSAPGAVVVGGTPAEIEQAAQLIQQRDQLAAR